MATEAKITAVAEIKQKIAQAKSVVVTDYRGLTVDELAQLRRSLRATGVEYKIVKNTLTKLAVDELELSDLDALLEGPTAMAFSYEDAVAPAKLLNDFAKKSGVLKLKGMLLEGKVYDAEGARMLATLPGRDELIAKLLGTMNAPIAAFARVLAGPIGAFARVCQAIADQRVAGGEAAPVKHEEPAPVNEAEPPAAQEAAEEEAPAAEEIAAESEAGPAEATTEEAGSPADETPIEQAESTEK